MQITDLKTNRLRNPLGYDLGDPRLSFIISGISNNLSFQTQIKIASDIQMQDIIYDSGLSSDMNTVAWKVPFEPAACTRYYWQVMAATSDGMTTTSETAWFETAKMDQPWQAKWISPDMCKDEHPLVFSEFTVNKPLANVRVYACGLGVYELYIDGQKIGQEYLLPGLHDYNSWIQYQTYNPGNLKPGKHKIAFLLGNGWYKGRFGLDGKDENYGDNFACIAEIHLYYADGDREIISTDTKWKACRSQIMTSSIYDGEIFDATFIDDKIETVKLAPIDHEHLQARLSPPILIHERLKPVSIITTPAGETVLDMGQNMVGWLEFAVSAPAGQKIELRFGEILQNGNFYQDNLRTAKARFLYISDGNATTVRPHFTFFGFRYVLISGWPGEPNLNDFTGCVIHSGMEETGKIETSDSLINQLIRNVRWSQKGNFLDVPTDCPQRDERMGWTGDAQIFCGTACFNMDVYAFFAKYCQDMTCEQKKHGGSVPHVVPTVGYPHHGSAGWGDAAVIIPWQLYLHYGDIGILERQFSSMQAWVDYIRQENINEGDSNLWRSGYHFGDWLALDGPVEGGVYSGTDPHYISSAYYYYSTRIVAMTAEILGKDNKAEEYGFLSDQIKQEIQKEYFTPAGRLSVDTQTGHVLALFMDLAPENSRRRIAECLAEKIAANGHHLDTGFIGTPYLCHVLSTFGYHELACDLLFSREFPSWIYEIMMGATTIWERWNSVLPDGRISGTRMNSLNHYAYGSITEWLYRHLVGINPSATNPGFKEFSISPKPDYRFSHIKGQLKSPYGIIRSEWEIKQGLMQVKFTIPCLTTADITLPRANAAEICKQLGEKIHCDQYDEDVKFRLPEGDYSFCYSLRRQFNKTYSIQRSLEDLMQNEAAKEIIIRQIPQDLNEIPFAEESKRLIEILHSPFVRVPQVKIAALDKELRSL